MRNSRIIAALGAFIMAFAVLMFVPAPANAVDTDQFKVFQANLGSGKDSDLNNDDVYAGHNTNEDPITDVSRQAAIYDVHVIVAQEVCQDDVARMVTRLNGTTGATWTAGQFHTLKTTSPNYPNDCQQPGRTVHPDGTRGSGKGNVIFTRLGIDAIRYTPLGTTASDGRIFALSGIDVTFQGTTVSVYTTHLPSGSDAEAVNARFNYAQQIKNVVDAREQVVPTVLAGDFNIGLKTNVTDLFHRINQAGTGLNSDGKFWEADHEYGTCSFGYCRDAEKTIGTLKYDYVYFGKKYGKSMASVNMDLLDNSTSNHKIAYGRSAFTY